MTELSETTETLVLTPGEITSLFEGGKPGETVRPPSQRRASGRGHEWAQARIGPAQRGEAGVEIAVGMDVGLHGRCHDLIGSRVFDFDLHRRSVRQSAGVMEGQVRS